MNNAHAATPILEPLPTEPAPTPPNVHAQAASAPARPATIVLTCDNCGYKLAAGSFYCPNCQAVFSVLQPAAVPQGQAAPAEVAPPKAHVGQIVIMWVVTLLAWSAASSGGPRLVVLLIDAIPFILAVDLARQKSGADRVNGMVKLALELVGFLAGLSGAMSHPQ